VGEDRAQWHLDFNKGQLPMLETPEGDMIAESDVLMNFAQDAAPE
jgi:glutathione S-transferase